MILKFLLFRERQEEEERKRLGIEKKEESDEEEFAGGDPFKRLDVQELKKKVIFKKIWLSLESYPPGFSKPATSVSEC